MTCGWNEVWGTAGKPSITRQDVESQPRWSIRMIRGAGQGWEGKTKWWLCGRSANELPAAH